MKKSINLAVCINSRPTFYLSDWQFPNTLHVAGSYLIEILDMPKTLVCEHCLPDLELVNFLL